MTVRESGTVGGNEVQRLLPFKQWLEVMGISGLVTITDQPVVPRNFLTNLVGTHYRGVYGGQVIDKLVETKKVTNKIPRDLLTPDSEAKLLKAESIHLRIPRTGTNAGKTFFTYQDALSIYSEIPIYVNQLSERRGVREQNREDRQRLWEQAEELRNQREDN